MAGNYWVDVRMTREDARWLADAGSRNPSSVAEAARKALADDNVTKCSDCGWRTTSADEMVRAESLAAHKKEAH